MKSFWVPFLLLFLCAPLLEAQVPRSSHVVLVVEENRSYESVVGNTAMPYFNSLAQKYGLATQYYANSHYSLPNYMWLTTGSYVTLDDGSTKVYDVDNVVRQMLLAGKTWKGYIESLPSVGYTGASVSPYARDHNPFVFLSDVANSSAQLQNVVPFTQFPTDLQNSVLPDYSLIVPNNNDNGHNGNMSQADQWLQTNVGPLLSTPAFQAGGTGILIITFDESADTDCRPASSCPALPTNAGGGRVATVVISPMATQGFQSTTFYQHPSVLRSMLDALGVTSFPNAAASAPDMAEFFSGATIAPAVTITSPQANATVTSPFTVTATFNKVASYMKLWVDGSPTFTTFSSSLSTTLNLAAGTHRLTVQASSGGTIYSKSESVTVSSGTTGGTPAVTISSPAPNASVTSPVSVSASFNGTASYMKLWMDGTATFTSFSSSLSTSVTLGAGTHRLTVQASSGGTIYSSSESITVTSSSPSPTPVVTITSPAANSTVSSPVTVNATFSGTASYMKLWVDGSPKFTAFASSLSTSVALASGTHRLVVQASSGGTIYSAAESVAVP